MVKELSEKTIKKLENFFTLFDKDKDGSVNASELTEVLKSNGQTVSSEDISHFMETFDANKDGLLNFEEFMVWWNSLKI